MSSKSTPTKSAAVADSIVDVAQKTESFSSNIFEISSHKTPSITFFTFIAAKFIGIASFVSILLTSNQELVKKIPSDQSEHYIEKRIKYAKSSQSQNSIPSAKVNDMTNGYSDEPNQQVGVTEITSQNQKDRDSEDQYIVPAPPKPKVTINDTVSLSRLSINDTSKLDLRVLPNVKTSPPLSVNDTQSIPVLSVNDTQVIQIMPAATNTNIQNMQTDYNTESPGSISINDTVPIDRFRSILLNSNVGISKPVKTVVVDAPSHFENDEASKEFEISDILKEIGDISDNIKAQIDVDISKYKSEISDSFSKISIQNVWTSGK